MWGDFFPLVSYFCLCNLLLFINGLESEKSTTPPTGLHTSSAGFFFSCEPAWKIEMEHRAESHERAPPLCIYWLKRFLKTWNDRICTKAAMHSGVSCFKKPTNRSCSNCSQDSWRCAATACTWYFKRIHKWRCPYSRLASIELKEYLEAKRGKQKSCSMHSRPWHELLNSETMRRKPEYLVQC